MLSKEPQSIDKSGIEFFALPFENSLEACRFALQVSRITFRNSTTSEEVTKELSKEQESNEAHYKDKETGAELEVIEKMPLLEWLANNYKKFGCQLEFVTNKSQVQLCKVGHLRVGVKQWPICIEVPSRQRHCNCQDCRSHLPCHLVTLQAQQEAGLHGPSWSWI